MADIADVVGASAVEESAVHLDDFAAIVQTKTSSADYPFAAAVEDNALIYRADELRAAVGPAGDPKHAEAAILAELAKAFHTGPGIAVFKGAFEPEPIEAASAVFWEIIEEQQASNTGGGDHFAKPGANDRIWNALEKLALRDPQAFVQYYDNDILGLAARAWLGPAYQVTSQVNVVNPGGEAQQPHRDYHLGFMTNEQAAKYPAHAHALSPVLTLQGAVAHCDMPLETGPTLYLPHSQKYPLGYLAWRKREFIDYFAEHRTQLPLELGDAVFFNPALFHAAGSNVTPDVKRIANLLQVSSAMGRALEWVDREAMCLAIYPTLAALDNAGVGTDRTGQAAVARVIAACAEGYPFPCSLDVHQPVDGLTPASQADILHQAVSDGWTIEELGRALRELARTR